MYKRLARKLWSSMKSRCDCGKYLLLGIPIRVTRDWFIRWASVKLLEFFRIWPNEIPSVDRIDERKGYEWNNIRLWPKRWNSGRRSTNKIKTVNELREILRLNFLGLSYSRIARLAKCSVQTISRLVNRKTHEWLWWEYDHKIIAPAPQQHRPRVERLAVSDDASLPAGLQLEPDISS
jgi:hypothetical protein